MEIINYDLIIISMTNNGLENCQHTKQKDLKIKLVLRKTNDRKPHCIFILRILFDIPIIFQNN